MMKLFPPEPEKRQTYLVRFWFDPESNCWRAYVQEASTGVERIFASFPELVAHLAQRLGVLPDENKDDVPE